MSGNSDAGDATISRGDGVTIGLFWCQRGLRRQPGIPSPKVNANHEDNRDEDQARNDRSTNEQRVFPPDHRWENDRPANDEGFCRASRFNAGLSALCIQQLAHG